MDMLTTTFSIQAQFTTYQCNPNTTRKDINSAFEDATMVGEMEMVDSFVSVVCLDEIGLAEGSTDTPLKVGKMSFKFYLFLSRVTKM